MRASHGIGVALALLVPTASSGQTLPEPGERVRMTHGGWVVLGELTRSTEDSLWVSDAAETVHALPLAEVDRLQRSLGKQGQFGRRFVQVAGLGVLGGGLLMAVTWSPCGSGEWCLLNPDSRTEAFTWGMVVGGVIGVPVGILAGLASNREKWADVDLAGIETGSLRLRPVIGPRPGIVVSLRPGRP